MGRAHAPHWPAAHPLAPAPVNFRRAILFLLVASVATGADPGSASSSIGLGQVPGFELKTASVGADAPPLLISHAFPQYPPELVKARIQGTVLVQFVVATDGSVQNAHAVSSPFPALSRLAVAAVSQWKFIAGFHHGAPAAVAMAVPIEFNAASPARGARPAMTEPNLRHAGLDALKAHDYDRAISVLTQAVAMAAGDAAAYELRGIAYNAEQRNTEALADFKTAARLDPKQADYRLELAEFLRLHGSLTEAVGDYTLAAELDPKNIAIVEGRVRAYLALHDYPTALADVDLALQLNPGAVFAHGFRAQAYQGEGREAEALDSYAEEIRLAPKSSAPRVNRAQLLVARGDFAEAQADLKTAVAVNPSDVSAVWRLAWLLATCPDGKVRDGVAAVAYANDACQLVNWRSAEGLEALAAANAEAGNFAAAVKWELRGISLHPANLPDYLRRLALYEAKEPYREPAPDPEVMHWRDVRDRTFTLVWSTVNESYYDPTFGGVDWAAVQERYRGLLDAAKDNEQLRELLQGMLGQLQRTHFAILPRESAVFNPAERVRIGAAGAECAWIDHRPVVTEVAPDSSAARMGLRPGDAVLKIDGVDLAPVLAALAKAGMADGRTGMYVNGFVESRLSAAAGTDVKLEVAGPDGAARTLTVQCGPRNGRWSEPIGNYPSVPIHFEARHEREGIAYLRFGIFAPQVMKEIRAFLRSLRPDEGLIVDLRGNPGGVTIMAAGIAGLLSQAEFSMGTMHLRDGQAAFEAYPQDRAFAGPVAVLIDGGSASTSEIFAAALQESGRARVFGEPSAGAALPSSFKALPTGDLFQYAIADIKTPKGVLLEGLGVIPDQLIRRTPAELAAGTDAVVAAASTWLEGARHRLPAPTAVAAQ
jgi:carboxyl-terminal processing protease